MRKGGCKVGTLRGLAFAAGTAMTLAIGAAEPDALPLGRDLRADGRSAAQLQAPILLMFGSDSCGYCRQVEGDYLKPLLHDETYRDKVLIRKIRIGDTRPMVDFDGATVETQAIARRFHVDLAPTLVFVDPQGREIGERLIGLSTVDFYWGYLERSLTMAREQLGVAPGAEH